MLGTVTMVVNAPGINDTATLAGQQAEADWIYVTDYGSGVRSRAFRVFDDCCRPPGGITFGMVDLVARFNSLDLVDIDNPEGGFLTESVDPLPVAAPVPEPGAYMMLLAGLGLLAFVARRRASHLADGGVVR
ncbi:MAG: PEP-CTERM sorting domain-containing protein [Burkholderiales bacterium]|nr:PEP-CTERM sorting domain-containing protein [Burkholderiales bacterium]